MSCEIERGIYIGFARIIIAVNKDVIDLCGNVWSYILTKLLCIVQKQIRRWDIYLYLYSLKRRDTFGILLYIYIHIYIGHVP